MINTFYFYLKKTPSYKSQHILKIKDLILNVNILLLFLCTNVNYNTGMIKYK